MKCHFCGQQKESLPFHCRYCGEFFCPDHRLPENHSCPRISSPILYGPIRTGQDPARRKERPAPFVRSNGSTIRLRYAGIFTKTELRHVTLASAVLTLVGLSLVLGVIISNPLFLILLIPGFLTAFLGHEILHKFVARRNGLWAEFRTSPYGLVLTAISFLLPFKFLAPGQTTIRGNAGKQVMGSIGLVGPGFNLVFGAVTFISAEFAPGVLLSSALLGLSIFNGWLALINLIPFGSFDGTAVFSWDKARWLVAIVAAVVLVVLSSYPSLI